MIDTPGRHKGFTNTMRGISQADAAILVVEARDFSSDQDVKCNKNTNAMRQTKEFAVCAQAMGIRQIIVAINIFHKVFHDDKDRSYLKNFDYGIAMAKNYCEMEYTEIK